MYAPPISTHRFRERIFVGVVLATMIVCDIALVWHLFELPWPW
jgi:hypothetical protein